MISSISFKSTYVAYNHNPTTFSEFQEYATKKANESGVTTELKDEIQRSNIPPIFNSVKKQILIVPDDMDSDVEKYCAVRGISYTKLDSKDLLTDNVIMKRIANAPDDYKRINVNATTLKKLSEKYDSNIQDCEQEYKENKDAVNKMLKSGEKIPVTRLFICKQSDETIKIYFKQRTDAPDHCVYFALQDLGIEDIPVYIDDNSYKLGKQIGLFKNTIINN